MPNYLFDNFTQTAFCNNYGNVCGAADSQRQYCSKCSGDFRFVSVDGKLTLLFPEPVERFAGGYGCACTEQGGICVPCMKKQCPEFDLEFLSK